MFANKDPSETSSLEYIIMTNLDSTLSLLTKHVFLCVNNLSHFNGVKKIDKILYNIRVYLQFL